jgi:peptidoglycan/xylan/chitin deacetylase (PgdA/CDA1 family)
MRSTHLPERHEMRSTMKGVTTLLVVGLILLQAAGWAPTVRAASPSPADPRTLVLEAGPHVGFRFAADGAILAHKRITLNSPTRETTTGRHSIPGRGLHLRVASGALSGYYVAESTVSYVKGMVGSARYAPPVDVLLPRGTVVAYRFDDDWELSSAVIRSVDVAHHRLADRTAVINGQRYYARLDGVWSGTWMPADQGAVARRLSCTTGAHAPVGTMEVLRHTADAGSRLALTFDMGGRLDPAMRIMRYLLLNGVCTTIFPTGAAAQTTTGRAVLAMVRRYPALFEVGNHTMNHCDLVRGGGALACPDGRPSDARVRRELVDAAAVIGSLAGESPVPYWRPPFGSYDTRVRQAATSVSYSKTVLWDIDTIDWLPVGQGGPTAADIASKIVSLAGSGSIVLMHLGGYRTRAALPAVLYGLRSTLALQPTSLSDLLARR